MSNFVKLSGCIVATVTPMKANGTVDLKVFKKLIDWFIAEGVSGICVAGTTGESPTLTHKEHSELIAKAVEYTKARVPIIAGVGANSTAEAVSLTREACNDGADYCLSIVPYYNKPTQLGLLKHFEAVANVSSKPVILYNVPSRTITDLNEDTLAKLAKHKMIKGIKDATGNIVRLHRMRDMIGDDFNYLSGDDWTSCIYVLGHGDGAISVTANIAPRKMSKMLSAAYQRDRKMASTLDNQLSSFNKVQGIESSPIPVKWVLQEMKKIGPGIRLPLTPLLPQYRKEVIAAAKKAIK